VFTAKKVESCKVYEVHTKGGGIKISVGASVYGSFFKCTDGYMYPVSEIVKIKELTK